MKAFVLVASDALLGSPEEERAWEDMAEFLATSAAPDGIRAYLLEGKAAEQVEHAAKELAGKSGT